MSCVGTEQKVLEPKIEKPNNSDEQGIKNGKPCIDFQPDDRWQIKDEDSQKKDENEKKDENAITSKMKDASCSNGRRSTRSRSKNCAPLNGEANDSSSDSEAPVTNTVHAIVHTEEAEKSENQKIRSKRKRAVDIGNGQNHQDNKKMKVGETDCDIKVENSSDGDQGDEVSVKDEASNNSDSVHSFSEVKTEKTELDLDSIEVIEESKDVSNESSKSPDLDDEDGEMVVSPYSENSSESQAKSIKEIKDEDIEVISDTEMIKNSDDESDSEVQILGSEEIVKEEALESEEVPEFKTSSDLDIRLSAGYMYYNSLKEKILNFKAGAYKPVKFPHTGTLLLAENEVIIESPSLLVPLLIKETDEFPNLEGEEKKKEVSKQPLLHKKNFFQSSVGQFLINLGMSRAQEFYHRDMKRIVQKQLKSVKSVNTAEKEKAVAFHDRRNNELKEINAVFNSRLRHCKHCDYKTESAIVLEGHCLTPHLSSRREFKCSFCDFMTRDPCGIAFHYEAMHSKKVILDSNIPLHECMFCSFSSTLKNKVNMHMNRCRKQFIPSQNLAPAFDFEFPGVTTKPVTMADVVGHRRLIFNSAKSRGMPDDSAYTRKKLVSVLSKLSGQPDQSQNLMKHLISPIVPQLSPGSTIQLPPGIVITRPRGQPIHQMRPIGRGGLGRFPQPRGMQNIRGAVQRRGLNYGIPSAASHLASSGISITPVSRGSTPMRAGTLSGIKNITLTPISNASNRTIMQKPNTPQPVALFTNLGSNPRAPLGRGGILPTLRTMPPYQRANTPPSQVVKGSSGNSFVVCEICDSYIKDLEELRTHMNFMHKVKIHPKMLVSRPPLNCQKCQWRFFTDQGLERHLLGAHGLVTTNMQEMANKNQDGGRCIICGAVFTYKLVSHMTQVHKVTLKPAHLSYKCTVCTATFTLYRLFESHVYNEHSGSAKRSAEESPAEPPPKKVAEELSVRRCNECNVITDNMQEHLIKLHMKECFVKLCRIEKCKKCLYSSDEMLVIRMSDFGLDDEMDDDDDDSSEESESSDSKEDNEG